MAIISAIVVGGLGGLAVKTGLGTGIVAPLLGFGAKGVAAKSLAAGAMSFTGNVAASSTIAKLTSIGMLAPKAAGFTAAASMGVPVILVGVAGGAAFWYLNSGPALKEAEAARSIVFYSYDIAEDGAVIQTFESSQKSGVMTKLKSVADYAGSQTSGAMYYVGEKTAAGATNLASAAKYAGSQTSGAMYYVGEKTAAGATNLASAAKYAGSQTKNLYQQGNYSKWFYKSE